MGSAWATLDNALDAARAGDARAFEVLVRAFSTPVVAYLRARGASDPDSLANEVFLRAFRNVHTVRGDAERFRSWLFGIAHNAAVDENRWRSRRPREVPIAELPPAVEAQPAGEVEAEAVMRLERAHVEELLGALAPDQRDVLLLRVLGDLSVSQTAAVLGKSHEAVKALQRRGIVALRKRIADNEGVPT